MTPDDIIAAALECMGTPFLHQGRVPGVGMDCAGVLVHCFKRLGLPHQDERGYPRTPFDGQLERILDSQPSLQRIALADAGPGDWLIMRMSRESWRPQLIMTRNPPRVWKWYLKSAFALKK